MPQTEQARREQTRQAFEASVYINPDDKIPSIQGVTQNISLGGMFVKSQECPPIDAVLLAEIMPGHPPAIVATAMVVHVNPGVGFGCSFLHLPGGSRHLLDKWLGRTGGLAPISGEIDTLC